MANTNITIAGRNQLTQVALTVAEDTITFVNSQGNGFSDAVVELSCDAAWAVSHATGLIATKKPIAAATAFRINPDKDGKVLYLQCTAGGTLSVWVL
jgi:hypothetical protein